MTARVLGLVAVRLKSSRLPRKALLDLAGRPLIQRLHERLQGSATLSEIVWCTSTHPQDDPLEELAHAIGANCFRGSELDVIGRFLGAVDRFGGDVAVRITGDNPLTDPQLLDLMVRAHLEQGAEYSYNDELPRGTRSEVISVAALRRCHELVQDPDASEYMTLMLRRPDHFRVLRAPTDRPDLRRPELRLTVDTPQDYAVLRALFEAFGGAPPALPEVLAWLDSHPEVVALNQGVEERRLDDSINVKLKGD